MEHQMLHVREYITEEGNCPFSDWLSKLADINARAKIRVRINRLRLGNLGDHKGIGEGVQELRIDYGPGYRIYFGRDGKKIVILLCGGAKQSQKKDITTAKKFWLDYKRRKKDECTIKRL